VHTVVQVNPIAFAGSIEQGLGLVKLDTAGEKIRPASLRKPAVLASTRERAL
jgi:hypothetical protein